MSPAVADLRETRLSLRVRRLFEAVEQTRLLACSQQGELQALRRKLNEYNACVATLNARFAVGPWAAKPASAIPTAAATQAAACSKLQWLAYAVLASAGLALSLGVPGRSLQVPALEAAPARFARRPPAPQVLPPAAAPASARESDEEINNEALALIYAYAPPGGGRSVQEVLGPETESASRGSPWVFMRLDDKTALASFRPYGDVLEAAPVYEFVVDTAAKLVTASPETISNLRGADLASTR